MHELLVKSIWELQGEVTPVGPPQVAPTQDSYVAEIESVGGRTLSPDEQEIIRISRASYFIQANWDGSVAVGIWSGDDFSPTYADPEALLSRLWEQAVRLNNQMGGYGPAHLTVAMMVAQDRLTMPGSNRVVGRPPAESTIYAHIPARIRIDRFVDSAKPNGVVIKSIGREIQRAGGIRADEPS